MAANDTGTVATKTKVHVVVGHATVMAELLFFGVPDGAGEPPEQALAGLTRRIGTLAMKARRPAAARTSGADLLLSHDGSCENSLTTGQPVLDARHVDCIVTR